MFIKPIRPFYSEEMFNTVEIDKNKKMAIGAILLVVPPTVWLILSTLFPKTI